jgi:hypothetical protein
MKKKAILGLAIIFLSSWGSRPVFARNWHAEIDKYFTTKDGTGREHGDLYYDYSAAGFLAWSESYYLDSFLQLYRTYRDRKYLDRFKKHGDKIIENMSDTDGDGFSGWNDPRYGTNKTANVGFESYELLSDSVFPNGGFETSDGIDSTLPGGWTRWSNPSYAYRSPGGTDGYDGAYGVVKTTSNWSLLQYAWTTYKSSTSYQLSFVGKTNGLVKGRVDIRDETVVPPEVLKTYFFSDTEWTRHSFHFLTPLGTGHDLKLRFYYDNKMTVGGEADFDDVRLSENMIKNGGFEEGGTFPSHWFIPSGSGDASHFERTTSGGKFYSESAGLELRSAANTYEILEQYFPYEPGATYTVSFYAKTNGKVRGRLDVYDHDWSPPATQGQFTQAYFNHTDWRRYALVFTAPSVPGHRLGIRCFDEKPFLAGGLVYLDGISVVKAVGSDLPAKGTTLLNWRSHGIGAYPSDTTGGPSTALVLEGSSRAEQSLLPGYLPGWEYEVSLVGNGGVRVDLLDGGVNLTGRDVSLSSWTNPQTFRFKMPSAGGHDLTLRLSGKGGRVAVDDVNVKIASENIVHYGKIASPLAEFVTLVKSDPSLTATYGASAERYRAAIEDQIIPRWESSWRDLSPTQGVYVNPDDECQENVRAGVTLPHNQYLAFARLLLESYRFSGKTAYLDRAQKMGNAFKSKLRINPSHPTAYVWDYSNDMKIDDDGFAETHYIEDSSHANIDIGFAIEMNHQSLVFDTADMERFASTFNDAMNLSLTATYDTVDGIRSDLKYHAYGNWVNLAEFRSQVWTQILGILEPQPTIYYGSLPAVSGLCRWDPDHQTLTGPVISDVTSVTKTSTTITWSWADRVDNEYGFHIRSADDDFELVSLASGAVTWTEKGLLPNSGHKVRVAVFGASPSMATVGVSSIVFTLANAPINLATTSITATTVGLSFGTNSNPEETRYEVEQALGAGSFSLAQITTNSSLMLSGLSSVTSYRFRVRALNNDGIPTAYCATAMATTPDGTSPSIDLTTPTPGAVFDFPQTVAIVATATDNVGVSKIWFMLDDVTVSTDTTAPYSYDWLITAMHNGAHTWSATAFDAMRNSSTTVAVPVTVNIDILPPSTPILQSPTELSATSGRLNWSAATDNVRVIGYRLYRDTFLIATIGGEETSFLDSGLAPETLYKFTVAAFDDMGNTSAMSPELSVTTPRRALLAPRGSVSGVSPQSVGIRWTSVEGANRYTLAASLSVTSGHEFSLQREIPASEASDNESISGLSPNTTYYLYLNACNEIDCTDFVLLGSAVTHALAPALTAAEGKGKEVRLTINANGNPAGTKYRIERSRGGEEFTLATTATSLSPVMGDLTPGERYTFRVKAENHAGVATEPSNTLSATIAPETVEGARAYPVPFRPGIGAEGITFDRIPEGSSVKIYTADGRPVKTLSTDTAGKALWTLDNDEGSSVVSGVYMAVIEKAGARKKIKVVVQK